VPKAHPPKNPRNRLGVVDGTAKVKRGQKVENATDEIEGGQETQIGSRP